MGDAREHRAGDRTIAGIAIIAAGLLPTIAAVVAAVSSGVDLFPVVRLLITSVVYGPVAAIALSFRRPGITAIAGSLAITSGWFALAFILHGVDDTAIVSEAALLTIAHVSRLPEVAALSLIPWLVARDVTRPHRVGIAVGTGPVILSAVVSAVDAVTTVPAWVSLAPLVWAIGSFVAGAIVLRGQSRDADPRHREALRWFTIGVVLLVLSYGRLAAPLAPPIAALGDAAFVVAQALLPVGILATIVPRGSAAPRARTVDAIAGAQALAFGVGAYLAASALTALAGLDPLLAGALSAAALALVLGATSRTTRARVGRLFAERRLDAREVLTRLGAQVTADDGVRALATALRETWDLASVAIVLDGSSDRVQVGHPAPHTLSATLVSGGQRLGDLVLTSFDVADLETVVRPVLAQTAGLIAVAVHLASINEEVAATRYRTLDLRRQERRRLHAELHDDVAPALAGIGFGMAGADALLARGRSDAAPALARLRDEVSATTETVRALARALLPTALDQGDLAGALDELARASAADGTPIRILAEGSDVLPAERQLALYLLVAEVVRVARRSDAVRGIAASVVVEPDVVVVSIRVDGDPDSTRAVHGTVERRVRELGGRVQGADAVIPR